MPLTRRRLGPWFAGVALGFATRARPVHAQGLATVAAAADPKFALEELAARSERASSHRLRLVFRSSGHLKTQVRHGAPFHLFLSADEAFVFELADAGPGA